MVGTSVAGVFGAVVIGGISVSEADESAAVAVQVRGLMCSTCRLKTRPSAIVTWYDSGPFTSDTIPGIQLLWAVKSLTYTASPI